MHEEIKQQYLQMRTRQNPANDTIQQLFAPLTKPENKTRSTPKQIKDAIDSVFKAKITHVILYFQNQYHRTIKPQYSYINSLDQLNQIKEMYQKQFAYHEILFQYKSRETNPFKN